MPDETLTIFARELAEAARAVIAHPAVPEAKDSP